MTKDEVLNSAMLFLEIYGQDKRLVTALQNSLESLFRNNGTRIPFESLSIEELKGKIDHYEKMQASKSLPDSAKEAMKKRIPEIEKRIKDLS
jgi:hypothetical protein